MQKLYDQSIQMDVGITDSGQKEIFGLMNLLDHYVYRKKEFNDLFIPVVKPEWRPKSKEYHEIIIKLIDPTRRNNLRKWFADSPKMNPSATGLRDALSDMTGEELNPNY